MFFTITTKTDMFFYSVKLVIDLHYYTYHVSILFLTTPLYVYWLVNPLNPIPQILLNPPIRGIHNFSPRRNLSSSTLDHILPNLKFFISGLDLCGHSFDTITKSPFSKEIFLRHDEKEVCRDMNEFQSDIYVVERSVPSLWTIVFTGVREDDETTFYL